ncbi:MAG: hypothetical protein GY729_20060, partial [Desulfobacteraceae bacterium]|nr:hypothetical protein [Desulfobacteraceae bacterium]
MTGIALSLVCFSGFVFAANHWLKIKFSFAPLFAISFLGVCLFFFAVTNHLEFGTWFLIVSGFLFFIPLLIKVIKKPSFLHEEIFRSPVTVFIFLCLFSYTITLGMSFTVIDDYVYWGIMGKYLFWYNQLPGIETTIIPKHLAYTPGTGLIHYFFYQLFGKYAVSISYFAQNMILVSSVFVLVTKQNIKKSLAGFCLAVVLLTLFCGSVFTKLQVDYLLSVFFFAVIWIWFSEKQDPMKLLAVSLPICFLFLIKQIGFALGLLALAFIFLDILLCSHLVKKEKLKLMGGVILVGAALFGIKTIWAHHCELMGFTAFNNAINFESIKTALHIFSNDQIKKGFFLFIKDIFLGPADRLNLPYLVWDIGLGFLWIKLLKDKDFSQKKRYGRIIIFFAASFVLYVAMLYFLQVIVFKVGVAFDHTVGLTRYLNIFFTPMVLFTVLVFFHHTFFKKVQIPLKALIVFSGLVILILGASRIETSMHREPGDVEAQKISNKISSHIDIQKT